MTDLKATRPALSWLPSLALAGYWIAVIRMLSPQWTVYVQYNYGWAMPFLCGYLVWLRWRDRPVPFQDKHPASKESSRRVVYGILLALFAAMLLPTRVIVEANPIWRAGSWAMAIELVGITLCVIYLAGGRDWLKHFAFPVVFFLLAVPWPSHWENALVQGLMRANTQVVVEIMSLVGVPALAHGNVIEIGAGLVGIDEACSGIRSLQATLMMALFFGELYRLRLERRLWAVLAGVVLALVCNVIRTLVLVWICHRSGLGTMNKWHDPTGVGILLACFTGLWVIGNKLRTKPPTETNDKSLSQVGQGFAGLLAPEVINSTFFRLGTPALLIWLIVVEAGTAAWFGRRETSDVQNPKWSIRWPAGKMDFRDVELSQTIKQELKFNEGRGANWSENDGTLWQLYYFRWGPAKSLVDRVHVQFAKSHRPEICLPATGLTLREDRGIKDFEIGEFRLPFRVYRFDDRGLPLHVYFCAWEDGTRSVANMRENPASRLAAALAGNRSLSQRVLEIALWGQADTGKADAALQRQLESLIAE